MAEDDTKAEPSETATGPSESTSVGASEMLSDPPSQLSVPPDAAQGSGAADTTLSPEVEEVAASQPEPATSVVAEAEEVVPGETVSYLTGSYRLPNGTAGKPYEASVDLREWGFRSAPTIQLSFAEHVGRLGLSAAAEGFSLRVSGTPVEQGEHLIMLHYKLGDDRRTFHKEVSWLINPDPKSLWKEVEPDTSLPYRKEHTAAQRLAGPEYQVVAASRRGRSHAHEGKFREDDFAVAATADGWYILLVADGAGSARFSREGSRLSCETTARTLEQFIPQTLDARFEQLMRDYAGGSPDAESEVKKTLYQVLCRAAFASYKSIEGSAAEAGIPVKDYATTLLLGIAKRFEHWTFVSAFWVGDGAIALLDGRGSAHLLGTPDGGEFSGQTRFLTMHEVIADGAEMLRRVRFTLAEDFGALILMTDGVSDPKFGTDNNLASAEKWEEFWREIDGAVDFKRADEGAPQRLLEWMDFWSPGEHDDRTIAVLC